MTFGALTGLGAATLALAASAPPLSSAPPAAPQPVVSRVPARTVPAAIDRAEALGAIASTRAARYRADWRAARRAVTRLPGARRAMVEQAMTSTRRLARRGALRAGRLEPALSGVRASVASGYGDAYGAQSPLQRGSINPLQKRAIGAVKEIRENRRPSSRPAERALSPKRRRARD